MVEINMKSLAFLVLSILAFNGHTYEDDKKYFLKALNDIVEAEKLTKICLNNSSGNDKTVGCMFLLRKRYNKLKREYPGLIEFRDEYEKEVAQFQKDWDAEIQERILLLYELKTCLKKETDNKSIKIKCLDPFKGKYQKYQSKTNFINENKKLIDTKQF